MATEGSTKGTRAERNQAQHTADESGFTASDRLTALAPVVAFNDDNANRGSSRAHDAEVIRAKKTDFHPAFDFFDFHADGIEEWIQGNEPRSERISGLRCFFWGIADDVEHAPPAWSRTKAWLEVAGRPELIRSFIRRAKKVLHAVERLCSNFRGPSKRKPTADDYLDLGVDEYIYYVRDVSRALKQQFPPQSGLTGNQEVGSNVSLDAKSPPLNTGQMLSDKHVMLGCAELAEQFGLDAEQLRGRLKTWRRKNFDGGEWKEVTDRKPREPRYLFRLSAVRPIISKMSGEESAKRPAK